MEYELVDSELKYRGRVSFNVDDKFTLLFEMDGVGVCGDGSYQKIPFTVFPELEVLCDEIETLTDEIQNADNEMPEEPDEDDLTEEEFEMACQEFDDAKEALDDLECTNDGMAISACEEFLENHLEQLMEFVTIVTIVTL